MTVTRVLLARIAAVGVCIVALAGMANAQISGRVVRPGLVPIDSAHVEVWSSYPDSSKLAAVFSNMNGQFTVGGLAAGTYDVRVWKGRATGIYYPTYAMDVTYPLAGELLLVLVAAPTIQTSPWSCDYSDPTAMSTFLGYPIRRGDVIGVEDPDGILCGLLTRYESDASDGSYLVHVYGDVLPDLPDEGAESGDILTFFINGKPATLTGGPGTWESPGFFEFPVSSTTNDFEAVKVTGPADVSVLEGATVDLSFTVTNQGNHVDGFSLSLISENDWAVSLPGGAASGSLNPGQSKTITVRVVAPSPISYVYMDNVYLMATSQANTLIKGTDYGHIEASPSGILEDNAGVPGTYFLAQNYPNPFNPATEISFGLELGGHTTVTVYNLLGKQVSQLLDEYRAAGTHTVSWNGTDSNNQPVPSGIYFYRVSANEFVQTRKMVLMK